MNDQPLVITPAQARYIADYLDHEFNFSFELDSMTANRFELEGADAIENAINAINGGAMQGFEEGE